MTTAQTILDRVRTQLIDDGVDERWSDTELLRWLSDAQRAITGVLPDAATLTTAVALVAGTKQSIPMDGITLLSVTRNMGTNGATAGAPIKVTRRELLDNYSNWHAAQASATIKNYIYDPRVAREFYVYPPSKGTSYVEIVYARQPAELAAADEDIVVTDDFIPALADYVMARAHQKDNDAASVDRAGMYMGLFGQYLAARLNAKLTNNPNLQTTPGNQQVIGAAQ